jgi:hypothetical protein
MNRAMLQPGSTAESAACGFVLSTLKTKPGIIAPSNLVKRVARVSLQLLIANYITRTGGYDMLIRKLALVSAFLWATTAFGQSAHADIVNAQGQKVGSAVIRQSGTGVRVDVNVSQLPPGTHGIHIHNVGKCEGPAFTTAGPHSTRPPRSTEKTIQRGHTSGTCSTLR